MDKNITDLTSEMIVLCETDLILTLNAINHCKVEDQFNREMAKWVLDIGTPSAVLPAN